jgi:hypothetical protein
VNLHVAGRYFKIKLHSKESEMDKLQFNWSTPPLPSRFIAYRLQTIPTLLKQTTQLHLRTHQNEILSILGHADKWHPHICPLLGYYAAYIGNSLPTFRSNFQGWRNWTSRPLNIGPIGCPETSVRNYHYTLYNRDFLTLEDGADRLSRKVCKELPLYVT